MCDNCCAPFIEGEGCSSALQKRASNVASGDYSLATGHGTIASNEGELSTGTYNKPNENQVFSVGVGTSDSNRVNAVQVNKDGSTSFLYNGQMVKLIDLIGGVSPSSQIVLDIRNDYIVVSYDGGQTFHNLIALSELRGGPGITDVNAQIDSSSQELNVTATLNNGVLTFVFSGLSGGTGPGGDTPTPSEPGRSIIGTQQWFKLSDSLSVTAPALSIEDPSSAAGGSWTTSQLSTTEQLPYLWTFIQYNYDKVLDTGYMYSRSSAWKVSSYNVDPSQEYEDLQRSIAGIYAELRADMDQYGVDLQNLSNALASLRNSVEGTITTELSRLRSRLASIDESELKIIEDDGLWSLMTSWASETGDKKAFADILADAEHAKIALDAGSTFFGANGHVGITLNGIEASLSAAATKAYVDSSISSAQFSVDPAALQSVISKGQQCWQKDGVLYPYNIHITDGNGFQTLVDYEAYMEKTPAQGGPSTDAHGPEGPFQLVAVIGQLSQIKQTADSISSSISEFQYMWRNGNNLYDFDDTTLRSQYQNRDMNLYENYTYENYVANVIGYEKVRVSELISGISQKSDEIEAIVGRVDKIWSKPKASGGYEYQKYVVPSNKTASQYETEMTTNGWTLTTYADEFGVISLNDDKIALAVKKSKYVWIDDSLAATSANYCKDYDAWLSDYEAATSYSGTYEQYVAQYHPSYTLTRVADSMSQIKQQSNRITSAVSDISSLGSRVSSVEQTASNISASVTNLKKVWKNSTTGEIRDYDDFRSDYNSSGSSTPYESWVPANETGYTLSEISDELGALSVRSDKIWAGVGDGNDVAASISILKGLGVNNGKIVLSANKVEVNGDLIADSITVDDLLANNATINETFTAHDIIADGGKIGAFNIINGDNLVAHLDDDPEHIYLTLGPETGIEYEFLYRQDYLAHVKFNYDGGTSEPIALIYTQETDRPALVVTGNHQGQYPAVHVTDGNVEVSYGDVVIDPEHGALVGNVISGTKTVIVSETMSVEYETYIMTSGVTLTLPSAATTGRTFKIIVASNSDGNIKSTNKQITKVSRGTVSTSSANTNVSLSSGYSYTAVYCNDVWYLYE